VVLSGMLVAMAIEMVMAVAIAVAIAVPAAAQAASAPAGPVQGISGAPATTVSLPTGDQVAVTSSPGGAPSYRLIPAAGESDSDFLSFDQGGDHYVVPSVAVPYLGTELSQSMFDVTALARDGVTAQTRMPVDLAFAANVTPTAPPGVMLTSVNGNSAQGYLTAGSGTHLTTSPQDTAPAARRCSPGCRACGSPAVKRMRRSRSPASRSTRSSSTCSTARAGRLRARSFT